MLHDATRGWSPFNFELSARRSIGTARLLGLGLDMRCDCAKMRVDRTPASYKERCRILIEEVGLSEEIVAQLPDDVPTPRPPGTIKLPHLRGTGPGVTRTCRKQILRRRTFGISLAVKSAGDGRTQAITFSWSGRGSKPFGKPAFPIKPT